jgi:hypothetical protein
MVSITSGCSGHDYDFFPFPLCAAIHASTAARLYRLVRHPSFMLGRGFFLRVDHLARVHGLSFVIAESSPPSIRSF